MYKRQGQNGVIFIIRPFSNVNGPIDPICVNADIEMCIRDRVYVDRKTLKEYLVGKSVTVTFGGQTKTIELIKEDEKDAITTLDELKDTVQKRLDRAFGSGKITADTTDGKLSFKTEDNKQSLTISADDVELRNNLGIQLYIICTNR